MKIKCDDFNLEATLESGQVFGFKKNADGAYAGNLLGYPVRLSQTNGSVEAEGTAGEAVVRHYFDLDRDLRPLFDIVAQEPALAKTLFAFRGLRLIRQDPWEALACFIISSNNNVKRIMGIHKNLVQYFSGFPSPAQLARTHERTLRQLGLGYRAPFLLNTAQFLSTNPDYLEMIRHAGYAEARSRVLAFPGIGPKVADCVLLYGFHRLDAFPVDVWMLRTMRKLYFRNRGVDERRIHAFGRRRWGPLAGYVQQYLFHGARTGVIE